MIILDVCLSDIPTTKRRTGTNGKVYTSIVVDNRKEVDDKGNTHSVYMNQTKEERAAKEKRSYIGNGKEFIFQNTQNTQKTYNDFDDLGF